MVETNRRRGPKSEARATAISTRPITFLRQRNCRLSRRQLFDHRAQSDDARRRKAAVALARPREICALVDAKLMSSTPWLPFNSQCMNRVLLERPVRTHWLHHPPLLGVCLYFAVVEQSFYVPRKKFPTLRVSAIKEKEGGGERESEKERSRFGSTAFMA